MLEPVLGFAVGFELLQEPDFAAVQANLHGILAEAEQICDLSGGVFTKLVENDHQAIIFG